MIAYRLPARLAFLAVVAIPTLAQATDTGGFSTATGSSAPAVTVSSLDELQSA